MSRRWRVWIIVVALLLTLAFSFPFLLRAAGDFLVESELPHKADAVIVLAGDWRGNRIKFAASLVKEGWVPMALVSGPMPLYGVNEADAALAYAVRLGFPRDGLVPVYIEANSTGAEAKAFRTELQKRHLTDVLIVTSNYHTRRSGETFRRILPKQIRISMIAAPDPYFSPENWWRSREGQKTFLMEATKTVAAWVGL